MTDEPQAQIFDIGAERAKRAAPKGSYFVRVDLYNDGIGGAVLDMPEDAATLRSMSEDLFSLGRHLRDMAWQQSGADEDLIVSVVRVFATSKVSTWTSNTLSTDEQLDWLKRRFDEAGETSRPTRGDDEQA